MLASVIKQHQLDQSKSDSTSSTKTSLIINEIEEMLKNIDEQCLSEIKKKIRF